MTSATADPMAARVVFWRNPSAGRLHVGSQIGDGPLLTAEGCQHDDAGDDIVEDLPAEGLDTKGLIEIAGAAGDELCKVCMKWEA